MTRLRDSPAQGSSRRPNSDALEMGNSPQIVKDHYFEIVDEKAAREYWSIKPLPQDGKIVAIA
jgi:hypothetical protein